MAFLTACSLHTNFRGIPDLPLGRNMVGLSLTTGAFTQQLPMIFTSISELDSGCDAGYDSGYDSALLVLSFPCAAFPSSFPCKSQYSMHPYHQRHPPPSWTPLFIFSVFQLMISCVSPFRLSAGSTSIIQSAMENLTTLLSLHAWLRHYTLVLRPFMWPDYLRV